MRDRIANTLGTRGDRDNRIRRRAVSAALSEGDRGLNRQKNKRRKSGNRQEEKRGITFQGNASYLILEGER